MARRRYYYRRSPRVVVAKKKWASNMKTGNMSKTVASSTTDHVEDILVVNSAQNSTPTPVIVKTGNFKIQGDCYISAVQGNSLSQLTQVILYVVYLPEVAVQINTATVIQDHPEWIMAWKVIDFNIVGNTNADNGTAFTFSSRLKRNLNSGDAIALVAIVQNGNSGSSTLLVKYAAQYWTCSN